MYTAHIDPAWDASAWRRVARHAVMTSVEPEYIAWNADAQSGLLLGTDVLVLQPVRNSPRVDARFLSLADAVLCHRDAQRHALLYRLLWRITQGEPKLLERATDPDVHRAMALQRSVQRDTHKMKAFVRFREIPDETDAFMAWFEPEHFIVDRVAPFFARRFAGMRWAILTPYRSVVWTGEDLVFGAGATRDEAPAEDSRENLWRTYYASIFNPARLKPDMMRSEMPQKYWKHLPEAALIPGLIRSAGVRVRDMQEREPIAPRRRIPKAPLTPPVEQARTGDISSLRSAADICRRCELWKPATRTVFGEGPEDARVLVIGEQPGDEEDLLGRPFVGPAGRLLDRAFTDAGIDRSQLYVTNAVKHFRFEQRGKFRLHRNPERSHEQACRIWLDAELARIRPRLVLLLGVTAARVIQGSRFNLSSQRGVWQPTTQGFEALATVHPAWVLRQSPGVEAYRLLVDDLKLLAGRMDIEGLRR